MLKTTQVVRLINDYSQLHKFVSLLEETESREYYPIHLMYRAKYDNNESGSSKTHYLAREYAKKDKIISTIKSMEVDPSCYGEDLNINALALYLTMNPVHADKAAYHMSAEYAKHCMKFAGRSEFTEDMKPKNIFGQFHSSMTKSRSRRVFTSFDLDCDKDNKKILENLNELKDDYNRYTDDDFIVIETNGGFHIHVAPEKLVEDQRKTFYSRIQTAFFGLIDKSTGSFPTPIPGCTQGTFVPNLI